MHGASSILELGTLGGYSTIWLARALPADGHMVTLELNPSYAGVAAANVERAGLAGLIKIEVGPALEGLRKLLAEGAGPFDLVFIDADKENNPGYLEWAVKLTHPGSVIVVDNVIREGAILSPDQDAVVRGTRRVLELMGEHPRLDTAVLQTVGAKHWDGFAIALVK